MSPKNIATTAVIALLVVLGVERYKTGGHK
jgi:hypothetical protein